MKTWITILAALAAPAAAPADVEVSLVADILPGTSGSGPEYLTSLGGTLYFSASGGLWRHDPGSGTTEQVASELSGPQHLTALGDRLCFFAASPTRSRRLWSYDGAVAAELPGWNSNIIVPTELAAYGSALYFAATNFNENLGTELWKHDGTALRCFDLWPGPGSSGPQHFIEYGGFLYFNCAGAPGPGSQLWRTNGTSCALAAAINPGDYSSPECFAVHDGRLFFRAYDGIHGFEIWLFDGASASMAADIKIGGQYDSGNPGFLCSYRDVLYFAAEGGPEGFELWAYDGARAFLVQDINTQVTDPPWADPVHHAFPEDLVVFEDRLYFSADDGIHGRELWSFDGERATMVVDLLPGYEGGACPGALRVHGNALYFRGSDGTTGPELWKLQVVAPSFYRGDSNADGQKDLTDALVTLGFIFLADPNRLACEESADANDSGDVDLSDAVFTLLELYRGVAPVSPSGCCADDTPDELTCEVYSNCR
jgi:ELWxxDGT repeat protein